MHALIIATVLVGSLLLAHFSGRTHPLSVARPLDVDEGLPLPEAGQASTVFSLTALFGTYLGVLLLLGWPALFGVATGTVLSLFWIRSRVIASGASRFEEFLEQAFSKTANGQAVAFFAAAVQCAYAASELLILAGVVSYSAGLRPHYAILFAVLTGLIGYFYVLYGGYLALYRTDIVQLALVGAMSLTFAGFALFHGAWPTPHLHTSARFGYWAIWIVSLNIGLLQAIYHFGLGCALGFGLLAAAPDAWKRVFVVTRFKGRSLRRFAMFVVIGTLPFVLMLPLASFMPPLPDGPIDIGRLYAGFPRSDTLSTAATIGLMACFLSSFNSALLASVQVGLIMQRSIRPTEKEIIRFHRLMAIAVVVIFLIFRALATQTNPYLLANFLLGPVATLAAIQFGTAVDPGRLPQRWAVWIIVLSSVAWSIYLSETLKAPSVLSTYEVNTVPMGVAFALVVAAICWLSSVKRARHG